MLEKRGEKKVAIFDIDGTVFRSSLIIELVEALIDADLFPEKARTSYEKEYIAWLNRKGNYDVFIMSLVKAFMTHLKGVHYGDFADIAEKVIEHQQDRVYRYTRDLLKELKKKKYFLLAI